MKIGDVVKLMSGGPWMTVIGASGDVVKCAWFNDDREYHEQSLPIYALARSDGK